MRFFRRLATAPIRFYRRFLSPLKPPMCRFSPTCSAYAVEAIETHGVVRGGLLASWRIARCNPFCRGGHDPVPAPGRWTPDERRSFEDEPEAPLEPAGDGPTGRRSEVESGAAAGEDPRS